jgi:hypothetical protein
MASDSEQPTKIEIEITAQVPQVNAFHRESPPGRSFRPELWQFAAQYIDYGCASFAQHNAVRPMSPTRDLVLAALVRRALVVTESVVTLIYRGLPEAALPLLRTILDIELNAKLVARDPAEGTAKCLAAYHYFTSQRHQQRILGDRATRAMLEAFEGATEEAAVIARRNKEWFESPGFAEVREKISAGKPWHGYSSAEEAFRSAGMSEDYFQSYDGGTMFVHVVNIDFDFASIENGRVMLKGPLTSDAMALVPILGVALGHLHEVLTVFLTDKKINDQTGMLSASDGVSERLSTHEAMGFLLGQTFPTRAEMAADRASSPRAEA